MNPILINSLANSSDICNNINLLNVLAFIGKVFTVLKILVPVLLIIYGTIDFIKQTMNPDKDNKNFRMFIKRIIMGVCIFFITEVVIFAFKIVNVNIENECLNAFLNPDKVSSIIDTSNLDETSCKRLGEPYQWEDNECMIDMTKNILE